MTNYVYDFADARLTQAALAGGVAIGVARYLKKSLPNKYELSLDERNQYLSWNLGVLYNAEQTNTDIVLQPTSYFHDYGQQCAQLLQSWGVTSDKNVALSADMQVTGTQMNTAINNYKAFASAVAPYGLIGYAQTSIIDLLVSEGISRPGAKHWLPGAISWSGYPNTSAGWNLYMKYPHAGMVQMLGSNIAGTDMNYLIDVQSMGFDWPAGNPYAPTIEEEDDMGIIRLFHLDPATTFPGFKQNGNTGSPNTGYYMGFVQDEYGNLFWDTDNAIDNALRPPQNQMPGKWLDLGQMSFDGLMQMCFVAPNLGPGSKMPCPGNTNFGAGDATPMLNGAGFYEVTLPGTPHTPTGAVPVEVTVKQAPTTISLTTTGTSTPVASATSEETS